MAASCPLWIIFWVSTVSCSLISSSLLTSVTLILCLIQGSLVLRAVYSPKFHPLCSPRSFRHHPTAYLSCTCDPIGHIFQINGFQLLNQVLAIFNFLYEVWLKHSPIVPLKCFHIHWFIPWQIAVIFGRGSMTLIYLFLNSGVTACLLSR